MNCAIIYLNQMDPMAHKKIIFAIPSLNEADNISKVARLIDRGLNRYWPQHQSVILNVDNNSPDGTGQVFLKTKTKHPKVYLPSPTKGKGINIRNALEYALKEKADVLAFIDGDVQSATPEWVKRLLEPVLKKGYDPVLPLYSRNRFDGSITNHLAYPVLAGFLNKPLRQPLAGEVALSPKAIKTFLRAPWPDSAYLYGIDIFLVTESVFHQHRLAHTFLGKKAHKSSVPKLSNMFLQVAESLFLQIKRHRSIISKITKRKKKIPIFFHDYINSREPALSLNIDYFIKIARQEIRKNQKRIKRLWPNLAIAPRRPALSAEDWAIAVRNCAFSKKAPTPSDLQALRALYFARFIDYYYQTNRRSFVFAEKLIQKQAEIFRTINL